MNIAILGPGCKNCNALEKVTTEAVAQLGLDATVDHVTDYGEIASYGIMSTPGLVVDGKVLVSGRVPTVAAVKEMLTAAV